MSSRRAPRSRRCRPLESAGLSVTPSRSTPRAKTVHRQTDRGEPGHVHSAAGFKGYLKPFIDQLDVVRWNQENENLPNKVWQATVEAANELLQNQSRDQTATRIPFEGRFERPDVGVWSAIGALLRNAFVEALRRGLEGSVDVQKVSGQDSGIQRTSSSK